MYSLKLFQKSFLWIVTNNSIKIKITQHFKNDLLKIEFRADVYSKKGYSKSKRKRF